jgi:hypothetical protein
LFYRNVGKAVLAKSNFWTFDKSAVAKLKKLLLKSRLKAIEGRRPEL